MFDLSVVCNIYRTNIDRQVGEHDIVANRVPVPSRETSGAIGTSRSDGCWPKEFYNGEHYETENNERFRDRSKAGHDRRLENADLFWGLRGGGGNFGVVTGIDYELHEVGPEIVGGIVAWADMKPFSTGGTYIAFQTADEGEDRMEAALGNALQRFGKIKVKWDPENVFRTNRNIKPARKEAVRPSRWPGKRSGHRWLS